MKKFGFLLVLAFGFQLTTLAQKTNLDSLHQVWLNETQPDTVRFKAYYDFVWNGYLFNNPDTAFVLAEALLKLAQEKENKKGQATALNIQGISLALRGDQAKALDYYTRSLKKQEEMGNKNGIANALNNIGIIYKAQGDHAKALDYYNRSLEKQEEMGNKNGIATSLNNIGRIYEAQGDHAKALDYYTRSLKKQEEIGDKNGIASSLSNIGIIYADQGDQAKALECFTRSLKMKEEIGDKSGIANSLNNIGIIYKAQGDQAKALDYYTRSLKMNEEIDDKKGVAWSLNLLGQFHYAQGALKQAESYAKQSLTIAQEIGLAERISLAAELLFEVYEKQEKGMKALEMYKLHIQMRDSIKSEEVSKQIAQAESRAEFEKELLIQEQQEKEAARIEAEKVERRNTIQYSGIGLGVFLLFGLVFFLGKVKLPKWAVELSVFLPFLIFFEFLLVITDSYVDAWSEGVPLIKLGINVLMAALIFPMHSFFESFLKSRLFSS